MQSLDKLIEDYKDKRVLIFGLGVLGRGLGDTLFFSSIGSEIKVTDQKTKEELQASLEKLKGVKAELVLGRHRREDIEWADVIVRNADVPWNHELLDLARDLNKQIVMDNQLFVEYAPKEVLIIGVTGTRGKTTTAKLISHVLRETTDKQVLLGGNVRGVATLPMLKTIKDPKNTIAVLELSSWQLQAFDSHEIAPDLAVITNIYPDHLNRYESMNKYVKDKRAIYRNQKPTDGLWLNLKQEEIYQDWLDEIDSEVNWFDSRTVADNINWQLKGEHNLENAAAAYELCRSLNIGEEEIIEAINSFVPVEYRLERAGEIEGAEIYNDSNSTTPVATIKALQSFDEGVNLIVGGEDKQLPIEEMVEVINEKAKKVYLISGSGTDRIKNSISSELTMGEYDDFEYLVRQSLDDLEAGDVLVFSPGFTSFNMFDNEYHRGDTFNKNFRSFLDEKKAKTEGEKTH